MDELYQYLHTFSQGCRLSQQDKQHLPGLFEQIYSVLDTRPFPDKVKLATGITAKGATGRIALNAYLLLLARKAYGLEFMKQDKRLEARSQQLAFNIMRSNFTHGDPKGIYCCPTCTLSVFPLYCTHAFPWFDCDLCKHNVLGAYENRTSVFTRTFNQGYADWAMSFV
jgi:hypothetical protein